MLPERSLDSYTGQIYHVRYPRARSCIARLETHYLRCVFRILIIIPLESESSSLTYNLEYGIPRYSTLLRRLSTSYHGTPFDVYGHLHRIDV